MDVQIQSPYCIYRIYSEHCLLYVGSTKWPLQEALHAHFFKKAAVQPIHIPAVTRIEYAFLPTEADMLVMEAFYINRLKPALNRLEMAEDPLTIELPELSFSVYQSPQLDQWKTELQKANAQDVRKCQLYIQIEKERQEKQYEIFAYPNLSLEEKQMVYEEWLKNFYEPVRNGLL